MPTDRGDGFMLDESDRLPWLEPAESVDNGAVAPARKVALLVLLFLLLLALVVGVGWWFKSRGDASADGDVTLIAAPSSPYRIPANEAVGNAYNVEGKDFAGRGDEAYPTSEGSNAMGQIDPSRAPETPLTDIVGAGGARPAAPRPSAAATSAKRAASAPIADGRSARPPARPAPVAPTPSPASAAVVDAAAPPPAGPQVQLGAYNSQSIAEAAWKRLVERFEELADASHRVEPVVSGGKTLYRLRMGVADTPAAAALCGRLRVAGESCWAVP